MTLGVSGIMIRGVPLLVRAHQILDSGLRIQQPSTARAVRVIAILRKVPP